MRELIDIASIYLALAVGFGALWYGVFSGGDLDSSIVRALLCALGALAVGLAAKAVWVMAVLLGGSGSGRRGKARDDEGESGEIEVE